MPLLPPQLSVLRRIERLMDNLEVRDIPINTHKDKEQVQKFLSENDLRMDVMDYYVGVFDDNDKLIAGGGAFGNIIKCIAVASESRELNITGTLMTRLREHVRHLDYDNIFVFTKTENERTFHSMSFFTVGKTDKAIMMESNPLALIKYKKYLNGFVGDGTNGCIVMNCNPFTKGHRYLIEQSAGCVDRLHIIMVKEGETMFPYDDRIELVRQGVKDLKNVDVIEGSSYVISEATFQNYFLKNLDEAAEIQVRLDLDVFVRHIAPELRLNVRFMGSEPTDRLTALYNRKMHELLPPNGIRTVELERLKVDGNVVSASRVRRAIEERDFDGLKRLVPQTTLDYILKRWN